MYDLGKALSFKARPFALGAIPCRSLPDPRLSFTIFICFMGTLPDAESLYPFIIDNDNIIYREKRCNEKCLPKKARNTGDREVIFEPS